jgi:hypothetical protein
LQVLDESGPILKTSLAKVTEAIAIDNLTSIVAGLGNVKRSLNDILKAGLEKTRFFLKKPTQWVFFCFFLFFLYICPEERFFRDFFKSRIL